MPMLIITEFSECCFWPHCMTSVKSSAPNSIILVRFKIKFRKLFLKNLYLHLLTIREKERKENKYYLRSHHPMLLVIWGKSLITFAN